LNPIYHTASYYPQGGSREVSFDERGQGAELESLRISEKRVSKVRNGLQEDGRLLARDHKGLKRPGVWVGAGDGKPATVP
jgi:hypothetical protein